MIELTTYHDEVKIVVNSKYILSIYDHGPYRRVFFVKDIRAGCNYLDVINEKDEIHLHSNRRKR